MHDASVFRNSKIGQSLQSRIPEQFHLLGDSAYPLSLNLMTPYKDTGNLTRQQTSYNYKLSKTRSIIERCFGLLKGRFRRLRYLDCVKTEFLPTVIMATCVLHNIATRNEEELEEDCIESQLDDDDDDEDEGNTPSSSTSRIVALNKRNNILQYVNS